MEKNEQLLRALVEKGMLTAENVSELEKRGDTTKSNLPSIIVSLGLVEEEKLTQIRAEISNLPYYNIQSEALPEGVLNFLPEEIARTYKIICFARESKTISIGLVETDLKAMEAVNFLASGERLSPVFYLISESSWQRGIKQYQKIEEEISTALEVKAKEEGEELVQVKTDSEESISDEDINSAPVSKIVSVIIRHAVEARASDIHIEPFAKESRVRYRIDGILHTSLTLPKSIHAAIIARIKVLAKLKLDETRIPQDGRIRLIINGREIDFRVSTLPLASMEKVVMRILDTNRGAPTLESLGFNANTSACIRRGMKKTSGILLVTGPTGSGKTTTLYAVLTVLNQENVNISTLEDPVEYEIKGVNQAQVRPKVGFTFASGLRSLLRQDPNIIMVGEIRDEETAGLAINAALTGHLVLSTLHTNDALGTIFRLLDMNVEFFLLSSTLKTVVAQRLARRLCDTCKQPIQLAPEELKMITDELRLIPESILKLEVPDFTTMDDFINKLVFYKAIGCPRCENTGYLSRTSVSEAIEINDELKKIINDGSHGLTLDVIKKSQDFISIKQDGFLKAAKGETTIEEILRVIES
jgi:Type II secretory pathway, ATPase PulE/Tfp pilus assembly pathway, ATPase PilB